MSEVAVLDLLLRANYVGRSAFAAMRADIDGLSASTSAFSRMGAAFQTAGNIMIAAGVATAVGIGYAVKAASDYETAINRLVSVTPDLQKHSQLVAQLNQQIGASSVAYGISPTAEAQGAYFLFSSLGALGKSPQQLLQANIINQLAQYVRASGWPGEGGVSYSDAAQVLPRLFAAGNVPMSQWGGDMGIMTYLENQAHTTQSQLAASMNSFLPIMTTLGIPFDQAATLMAATGSSGRVGAPAGREFMSALTLMMSGGPQQKELAALGLSNQSFFSGGKLRDTSQIMGMLQAALYTHAKNPADLLGEEHALFGQVGLRALGPLLSPGGFQKYQNLLGGERSLGILNNPKAAELYMRSVAGGMMQSPGSQWDRFKASMELLGITVGEKVLPPLMRLGNMLDGVALKLVGFINAHPQLSGALALGSVPGLIGGGLGLKGLGGLFTMLGAADSGIGLRNAGKAAKLPGILDKLTAEYEGELQPFRDRKGTLRLTSGETTATHLNRGDYAMMMDNYRTAHANALKQFAPEATVMERMVAPFKAIAGFGSRGALALPGLLGRVPGALGGLPGAFGGAIDKATFAAFPQLRLALAGGRGLGFPGLPKALGMGLAEDVKAHGTAFGGMLKALPSKALEGAAKGFGLLKTAITSGIPALLSFGGAALPIIAIILAVVGAITIGVLLFTRFRNEGQRLGAFFASVFGPIIRSVIGTAVQQFHQIQAAWKQVEPQVAQGIHKLVDAFIKARPFFQLLGTVIGTVFRFILTVLGGLVIGFIHALPSIIGFFTGILNIIGDVSNLVIAIFTGKWGKIPGIIGTLAKDIWNTITSAFWAIVTFVGDFIGHIIHFFIQLWDELVGHSIIPDMVKSIIEWFKSLPGKVIDAIAALSINLVNFFKNLAVQAGQWGINLIQGLINGIKGMAGNLGSTIADVAGGAISGFKNILGIHSPSTVFHEFGRMTVLGYTQGIQRHARDIDAVHGLFGLGKVGTLRVDNLHLPNQQPQHDNLSMFKLGNYVDTQRQRRMGLYAPDLDALAYQERIGSQYTA